MGAVALATQLLAGCYTYVPVDTSLQAPTGREVAVDITDRGRFELNGAIGQSPSRVAGRLVSATDTSLTLAVNAVQAIGGATSTWAGESVELKRSGVAAVRERKLSRSRTALLTAAIVAGIALVFTVSLNVFGGGRGEGGNDPGGGGGNET